MMRARGRQTAGQSTGLGSSVVRATAPPLRVIERARATKTFLALVQIEVCCIILIIRPPEHLVPPHIVSYHHTTFHPYQEPLGTRPYISGMESLKGRGNGGTNSRCTLASSPGPALNRGPNRDKAQGTPPTR